MATSKVCGMSDASTETGADFNPSFDRHSTSAGHCLLSDFEVDFISGLICDTGYSLVEDSMTTTAPVRKKTRTSSASKVDLNLIIPSCQRRSCTTTSKSEATPSSSSGSRSTSTPEKTSRRGRKKTAAAGGGAPHASGMPEFERNEYRRLVQHMVRMNKELAAPFMKPVPKWVPGYYEVITIPVDISMILNRLDSWFYASRADFEADMRQMFVNAYTSISPGLLST
ncbi:bromodomain-containing protein, putative, partial [Perkinsus marinus ATCC 50983]